jgi:protein-disulfide isomerase
MLPRMSTRPPPTSFVLISLALALACNPQQRPAAPAPAGGAAPSIDPAAPMARIGKKVITQGELLAAIKGPLGRLESEHAQQVHQLKTGKLEELVDDHLIEAKAKAENVTKEALLEREVNGKVPAPPDAEVQQVYDRTKASGREMPPFEQMKADIIKFLKERSTGEVRKAFVEKLRKDAKAEFLLPPLLPPKVEVSAVGPSKGDAKAPITIVEFSDFECPFCGRAEPAVTQVLEVYKGKVRLVYRDYPLPFHAKAPKASEAALCAGDQGKYWEMHGHLFKNQQAIDVPQLKEHAKTLGLDTAAFAKCLDGGGKAKEVQASLKAGEEAGVNGTPAFFINGRLLSGAQPFEEFKKVIDAELASLGK